jgi:hypothetical protein
VISLACASCGEKNEVESFLTAAQQHCVHCGQPIMGGALARPDTPLAPGEKPWERMEHAPAQITAGSRDTWVRGIATANFVFGGLYLACGLAVSASVSLLRTGMGKQAARDAGLTEAQITQASIISWVMIGVAVLMMIAGVGLLGRMAWGRYIALGLASVACVLAILAIINRAMFDAVLHVTYAGLSFFILLRPDVAAEFQRGGRPDPTPTDPPDESAE